MDLSLNLIMCGQVFLSFLLGGLIGLEREFNRSAAGIRTYAAVCMGSCVFGLISTHAQGGAYYHSVVDPTRVAAQVVSGIGFLGAGVIFKQQNSMSGLTTAATIWATAGIGLSIAFDMYLVGIVSAGLVLFLLSLHLLPIWKRFPGKGPKDSQEET